MIYEEKEFVVKDGLKVVLKTPDKSEAKQVLDFMIKVCGQTDCLLSSVEDKKMSVEDEEKWLEKNIEGEDVFICAYVDEKIVGDCSLNYNRHSKDKHRGRVGIVIDKDYWNKGLGSLLFDEMIRLAKKSGIEQLELGVNSANERAKRLYKKKGFEYTGKIPRALKLKDGSYYDEEFMVKFLEK